MCRTPGSTSRLPRTPMTVASTPHLRRLGLVITIASLAAIAYATLLPEPGQPPDARFCLMCGSLAGVDALLNVLLFLPFGVGLALCGVRPKRLLLMVSVLSILIEVAQFLIISGRDATISDVLTNTLGGALGFAAIRYVWSWLLPSPRTAMSLIAGWGAIWLLIQAASGFAFAPSIPESQYYGQLARSLGKNFVVFPGRVLAASLNGTVIPNAALADSHSVRQRLLGGATVATVVVPGEVTPGIAPIVRIAGAGQSQIILLAQNGADLLFTIRTGAAVLGLRSPVFALPRVFPIGPVRDSAMLPDTLRLSARYVSGEVRMNAQTDSAMNVSRVTLTASLGWTFVLPFQWFIEGTPGESVISWIWIVALTIPLGYWISHLARSYRSYRSYRDRAVGFQALPTLLWIGSLATLCVGLGLAPHFFGLSLAPVREWLGSLAGLLLGAALAARLTPKLHRSSENSSSTGSSNRVAEAPQSQATARLGRDVGRHGGAR